MNNRLNKTKFGLLCFDSENIGDEIQSLAAKRFLPRIDYYINRDNIDSVQIPKNESVKIILNSWFMSPHIKDGKYHWPPSNPSLDPLLLSMHVSFYNQSQQIFSAPQSQTFLKNNSPIGTRDLATLNFFESINIPAYFSGCLTLTLLPNKSIKKSNFILLVDVDKEVLQEVKNRTKRPIIHINTVHAHNYTTDERFALAQYWLSLYQSAHCIITPRLHAMLPGLAFGTPVIALSERDPERYSGLIQLLHHYTNKEFIRNKKISVNHPLKNPDDFIPLRDNLVETCKNFTNYDSKESFLQNQNIDDLYKNPHFISAITKTIEDSFIKEQENDNLRTELKSLTTETKDLTAKAANIAAENEQLQSLVDALKNPGVKQSYRNLIKACKRFLSKK